MDLFEKIKLIIETQGYIPYDIGNVTNFMTGPFLTPSNALIMHLTSLDSPNDHSAILPEDTFSIDAKFSPDDSSITVAIDYSGKEENVLYRLSPTNKERPIPIERLSKAKGRHNGFDWSPDGSKIVWAFSEQKKNRLVIQPNEPDSDELSLWEGDEMISVGHWLHPDYVKFTQIKLESKEFNEIVINPKNGDFIHSIPIKSSFSFDGLWNPKKPIIPYLNREDGNLTLFNVESNEQIILPQPEGEIQKAIWSTNGETLFISATKDARDNIYSIPIDNLELNSLPLPEGVNKIFKIRQLNNEEKLFFVHADATTRMNVWEYNLGTREYSQLTKKRSPKVGTEDFPLVKSNSEHWQSRDELQIHGFVMVPQTPPPKEGYPAIVYVHGGPMAQDIDSFVGTYQLLVQEGFVVFRPNFRGSTGYGEAFQKANFREIGKADLLDVVTGVEMLIKKYQVNPNKVAITGGSYGGYMTLRALTKPEIFKFAVGWAEAAISDWEYLYDTSDAIFRGAINLLFGPMDESRPFLKESSPIADWEKVTQPLGIVQLANDTRTPLKPVWEFAQNLLEKGNHVEVHVEPAMGHVSLPKGYIIRSIARQVQFFQKTLKN
ncbi:MAG: prolyl oligopeptidase family serine peptidase [Candidatus Hodarchaeales archaeon]|jgi:dipeptidyl aminopeptidase/acylaminoacyl peptidase